jgi:thiol-disulfide isomerase/thioredoxin
MKYKLFNVGIFILFTPPFLLGQNVNNIKTLKIGDSVPNIRIENIVNYPVDTAHLYDFEDKLLILDFWSTSCRPCIEAIPHLEQLKIQFDNQLQILMVTSQPPSTVSKFFSGRKISLASVTGDQKLSKLFPHKYVPHEVWIKNGKVIAITDAAAITADNIKSQLSDKPPVMDNKKSNFDYEMTKPLLFNGNGGKASDLLYHSIFTGYLDGIGGGGVYIDTLKRFKIRALNGTVLQLYLFAMRYSANPELSHANRCITEFDKQAVLPPPGLPSYSQAARNKYFCYELIVPIDLKNMAGNLMLEDLNRFFGTCYNIEGKVEKRTVKCWVLKRNRNISNLASKSSTQIFKDTLRKLIYFKIPFKTFSNTISNLYQKEPYPVIDSTGLTMDIDITIPSDEKDILKFKTYINQFGLTLELELCNIDMLVIKEIESKKFRLSNK